MPFPLVGLVIFDVGGTTVHLTVDVAQVFQEAFRAHGVSVSRQIIAPHRGTSKREAISNILQSLGVRELSGAVIYDDFQQRLLRELARGEVTPIDGVEQTFDTLRSAGLRVVLATGFDAAITATILKRLTWTDRIDGVVTADDVIAGRPAPNTILSGMRLVGERDPSRVAVVGDTANDIEAGRRAGVGATAGVLTGAHDRERLAAAAPTTILRSAADVPDWLGVTS